MRILIIGGTRFLGRHAALAARDRGHRVSTFHRGRFSPDGVPGCDNIIGDRTSDLARLTNRWDAVIDTSGYLPRDAAASAQHVHGLDVPTYLFVSTLNAYAEPLPDRANEHTPRWETGDPLATEMTPDTYGPLKARCEGAVESVYGGGALIVRPGLIVGPHDPTDRFTYWVRRIAVGGAILVPQPPERTVQIIDVRDLAEWMIALLECGATGAYNATGPGVRMDDIVNTCASVSGSDAHFKWLPEEYLLHQGVAPWSDMPLWLPPAEAGFFDNVDSSKARHAGLCYRRLCDTIRDTLVWDRTRDQQAPLKAGISRDREAQLLRDFNGAQATVVP